MVTTFKINAAEFNDTIVEKIKTLFKDDDSEVVISVRSKKRGFPKETREEYFARINRSLDNLDSRRGTVTVEDLIREQNYKGFDREGFDKLVAELNIQDPIEELLALVTK